MFLIERATQSKMDTVKFLKGYTGCFSTFQFRHYSQKFIEIRGISVKEDGQC